MNKKVDNKPKAKETPKGINTPAQPKISAMQLLSGFLTKTNIEIVLGSVDENIKKVSDGSIIISPPKIYAKYKDARS